MFVNSYLGICNICECCFSLAACIHEGVTYALMIGMFMLCLGILTPVI